MSNKPRPAELAAAHDYEYDTTTARELLRVAGASRPKAFLDARRSASARLIRDLCALFAEYGYQTHRRADREWGHVWSLTFFHESLCLCVAKDGRVHGWIQPHQGDRKLCGLDLSLTFDAASGAWMGPWPPAPVGQVHGPETGRTSALEELTRGVLVVIKHQIRQ